MGSFQMIGRILFGSFKSDARNHSAKRALKGNVSRFRRLGLESLEERRLLSIYIAGYEYDNAGSQSGTGWSYTGTAASGTLTLNNYAGTRIAASDMDLQIILADGSSNMVSGTAGYDGIAVTDGNLEVTGGTLGTGTLLIDINNQNASSSSNGISVETAGKNLTLGGFASLDIDVDNGAEGILVAGDLTVADLPSLIVNVDPGRDSLHIEGAINLTMTASDVYAFSGGIYMSSTGSFNLSQTRGTFLMLGKEVDYFVATEAELRSALADGTTAETVIVLTADITQASSSTTGFSTTATGSANYTIFGIGERIIKRGNNSTSHDTYLLTATTGTTLTLGVVEGMGSSSLAFDGGAVWADGVPVSYDLGTGDQYGYQLVMTKNANSGIVSTLALVNVSGTLNMHNSVSIQNNDSTGKDLNVGGGVRVQTGGIFNMDGGEITLNRGISGGGVSVNGSGSVNSCVFNLSGGSINNNAAYPSVLKNPSSGEGEAGGVRIRYGTFNMTGGEISDNIAAGFSTGNDETKASKGGGIHLSATAAANISGGEIARNVAQWAGGGIYVGGNGSSTMILSGDVNINHNLAVIGGGIFMNAELTMTGGIIEYNRVLKGESYVVCGNNGETNVTLPEGPGIYIRQLSSDYAPILTLSGSAQISTTNYVFIQGNRTGNGRYYIPIEVSDTLTVEGLVALFNLGFNPTLNDTEIVHFGADSEGNPLTVQENKFSIGYYLKSDGTREYIYDLKRVELAAPITTDTYQSLVTILESANYHARVGQYYFKTVDEAMNYILSLSAGDYELYLIYNAVLNSPKLITDGFNITIRSETETTQRAALGSLETFIDYAATFNDPVGNPDQEIVYVVENLVAYADFTMTAAREMDVTGVEAIFTIDDNATLTLGDAAEPAYICFDGNYNNPLKSAGFYVDGLMTMNAKAYIINTTNDNEDDVNGSLIGAVEVGANGVFDMLGGGIINCVGMAAGGVGVFPGGVYNFSDGVIRNCYGGVAGLWGEPADYQGAGGVNVEQSADGAVNGVFNMSGGLIEENTGYSAGGVLVDGVFTMTGGVIDNGNDSSNNTGNAVFQSGEFYLSGTARIGGVTDGLLRINLQDVYLDGTQNPDGTYTQHVITIDAPWTGGNTADWPLIVNTEEIENYGGQRVETPLAEVTYAVNVDHDLDGAYTTNDAAYEALLAKKIQYIKQWDGDPTTGIIMGSEGNTVWTPVIYESDVYTVQELGTGSAGKISTYYLQNLLIVGRASVAYSPNVRYTADNKFPEYAIEGSTGGPFEDPYTKNGDFYNGGDAVITIPFTGIDTSPYHLTDANGNVISMLRMLEWNTCDNETGLTMFPASTSKNSFTIVADTTLYSIWTDQAQIFVSSLRDRYELYHSTESFFDVDYDENTKTFSFVYYFVENEITYSDSYSTVIDFSDTISYYLDAESGTHELYWDYPTGNFYYMDGDILTEADFDDPNVYCRYYGGTACVVSYDDAEKRFTYSPQDGGADIAIAFSDTVSYYVDGNVTRTVLWNEETGVFYWMNDGTPEYVMFDQITSRYYDGKTFKSLRVAISEALNTLAYERATTGHYVYDGGAGNWNVTFINAGTLQGSYSYDSAAKAYTYVGYHQADFAIDTFTYVEAGTGNYDWETSYKEYVLISFDEDITHWEDYNANFDMSGATEGSYAWMVNSAENDWVIYLSGQAYADAPLTTDVGSDGSAKYSHYASLPSISDSIAIECSSLGRPITIDGCNEVRILAITGGSETLPAYLSGLRYRNGSGAALERGYNSFAEGLAGQFDGTVGTMTGVDSGNGGAIAVTSTGIGLIEGGIMLDNSVGAEYDGGSLYIAAGGTLELDGTSITHSNPNNRSIANASANTALVNANRGGGIYNAGTLDIKNSRVTYCIARTDGGGIYNANTLTISGDTTDDCYLYNNVALARGGGISTAENTSMTVTTVDITENEAGTFGGAVALFGNAAFISVSIRNNNATRNGGGICASFSIVNGVQNNVTVSNSVISGNSAVYGGGIINATVMTIEGSIISNNTATANGGGISNTDNIELNLINQEVAGFQGSTLTLTAYGVAATQIYGNTALNGYGGGVTDWGAALTVAAGTVITNNTAMTGGGITTTSYCEKNISYDNIKGNSAVGTKAGSDDSYLVMKTTPPWMNSISLGSLLSSELPEGAKIAVETEGQTFTLSADEIFYPEDLGLSSGSHDLYIRLLDADGDNTGNAYMLSVNVEYPAPTVSVKSASYADGQVLKLSLQAYRPTDRTIEAWAIDWGDGTTTVVNNYADALSTAHCYAAQETDKSYGVTLTLTQSGTAENQTSFMLLRHTVTGTGVSEAAESPAASMIETPFAEEKPGVPDAEPIPSVSVSDTDALLLYWNTRGQISTDVLPPPAAAKGTKTETAEIEPLPEIRTAEMFEDVELDLNFVTPESVENYLPTLDEEIEEELDGELISALE